MPTMIQLESYSPQRRALAKYMAEHSLNQKALAEKLGIPEHHFTAAIVAKRPSFWGWRYRLRIERGTGLALWTDAEETTQLIEIGKRLKVDLWTAGLREIRQAARKAGAGQLPIYEGVPVGFVIFRELLRHFFPDSDTHQAPHYS